MSDKTTLIKSLLDTVKGILVSEVEESPSKQPIEFVKALDTEKKQATFLAMMAFRDDTEYDLHGDTWDAEEVTKACHDFNTNCMKTNLGHLVMVDDGVASIVESYIAPVDMMLGDQFITKGSWLQVWQFADDSIWEGVKNGYWNGISPAFLTEYEELSDDES